MGGDTLPAIIIVRFWPLLINYWNDDVFLKKYLLILYFSVYISKVYILFYIARKYFSIVTKTGMVVVEKCDGCHIMSVGQSW